MQKIQFVYQCSNPECGMIFDENPNGHCPTCIKESGHGWSCVTRSVTPLGPKVRQFKNVAGKLREMVMTGPRFRNYR